MTAPVLEIRDLVTRLDTASGPLTAVNGISLTIGKGECLGLVGESGCGKTMAAMSVAGLLPENGFVRSGTIILDGVDLGPMPEEELRRFRSDHIGVVFQNPLTALNPRMNIGAQMREALPEKGHAANLRAAELLDTVGVPSAWDRLVDFPHELSGGLAQRVVIALALARNPRLLIADEPTTALDVSIQAQILDLIDSLRRDLGLGVLLVTHDMDVVAERAQKVAVMYAGNIIEDGRTDDILSRPVHPYTARLLASIPHKVPPGHILNPVEGAPPSLITPPPGCRFAPRCALVTDVCNSAMPELTPATGAHRFRCYHPLDENSPQSELPKEFVTHLPKAGAPLVEVQNVSRTFTLSRNLITRRPIRTRAAVSNVTIDIREGESLGIVGESGCGKSTLARLVAGLDHPTAGQITYSGKPLNGLGKDRDRWRREVQLIFQDPYSSLDPLMTVGEAIAEPLVYQGMDSAKRYAKVERLLEEVGLPPAVIDQRPAQISGGQRQRVGIARALAQDPKLIIADESVSALDVSVQATILNLFRRLQAERGLTYLFISHDLNVVRYMCDRVVVMYLGKPVEIASTEALFASPQHPYTRALLASIPGAGKAAGRLEGEIPSPDNPPPGCSFNTRCTQRGDRCVQEEPSLTPLGESSAAACFFPLGENQRQEAGH